MVQDYAGVIGISGNREGKVYFTAPRGMLSVMLMCMNETDTGEQNVRDLVGESPHHFATPSRTSGATSVISTPTICSEQRRDGGRTTVARSSFRSTGQLRPNVVVCLQ